MKPLNFDAIMLNQGKNLNWSCEVDSMSKIQCLIDYEKVACGDKRLVQDVDNLTYEFERIVTLDPGANEVVGANETVTTLFFKPLLIVQLKLILIFIKQVYIFNHKCHTCHI